MTYNSVDQPKRYFFYVSYLSIINGAVRRAFEDGAFLTEFETDDLIGRCEILLHNLNKMKEEGVVLDDKE